METGPRFRVLLPVDGSEFGRRGLTAVCRLLDPRRYRVTLLRVAPLPDDAVSPAPRPVMVDGWSRLIQSYESAGDRGLARHPVYASQIWEAVRAELMDEMAPEVRCLRDAGFEVSLEVRFGTPADEIIDRIADGEFDLVAMATHGRSGVPRMLLGSVAERVLRSSPIPVLMTRPAGVPFAESLPLPVSRAIPERG